MSEEGEVSDVIGVHVPDIFTCNRPVFSSGPPPWREGVHALHTHHFPEKACCTATAAAASLASCHSVHIHVTLLEPLNIPPSCLQSRSLSFRCVVCSRRIGSNCTPDNPPLFTSDRDPVGWQIHPTRVQDSLTNPLCGE